MLKILTILSIFSQTAFASSALTVKHPTCFLEIEGADSNTVDLAAQMTREKGFNVLKDKDEKQKTDLILKVNTKIGKDSQYPPCEVLVELFKEKKKVHHFKAKRTDPKTRQDTYYRCQLAAKSCLETVPHCVKTISVD